MITNKIEAIKKVRAYCEQEFGSPSGPKETKDFVETLMTRVNDMEEERFVSKFRELLGVKGTFAAPNSWDVQQLRIVLQHAFRTATGFEL